MHRNINNAHGGFGAAVGSRGFWASAHAFFLLLAACIAMASQASASGYKIKAPVDEDFYESGAPGTDKVELGRVLFFDKILSGNKNISCATCHGAAGHSGDNLSLGIGEGGSGFGVSRSPNNVLARVPRNAPPLFNVGAKWFVSMFADGRVQVDASQPGGFRTPAGDDLPAGLDNVLAAQALFPVQSALEMAGQIGSNPVADAAATGKLAGAGGVWDLLAERLREIPEYVTLFQRAYPSEVSTAADITFVHAANAIAAFENAGYRADNSPFDTYWRGNFKAMTFKQRSGMQLFYSNAKCSACHAGTFQSDAQFHAIAMPQIGPGQGDGLDGLDDYGRERVTNDPADRFKFKTPSLRNVELTAPYGHDGAYATLEAVIRHHLDPVKALQTYDPTQTVLPSRPDLNATDFALQSDTARRALRVNGQKFKPMKLSKAQIANLVEFLKSLTDPKSRDLSSEVPAKVPSGLTVGD